MTEAAAVYVDPSTLVPWDGNPRINEHVIDKIADSIQKFGFASPIVARLEDREIIAGHTRWEAARRLGIEKVPVRFMDITREQAHALALADNKLGELADWDVSMLTASLDELRGSADGALAEVAGWDATELSTLFPEQTSTRATPVATPVATPAQSDDCSTTVQPGQIVNLGKHTLHCADCVEVLRGMPANSVDSIVTDPPYGLSFCGKDWDVAVPGLEFAHEAFRVLKPGGYIIAFSATRTVHRLAVALEDAGLEIRDQIGWIQWQGFPKSRSVGPEIDKLLGNKRKVLGVDSEWVKRVGTGSRENGVTYSSDGYGSATKAGAGQLTAPASPEAAQYEGWGTCLKPAIEPAVMARKPLEGTVAQNVLKYGVGAINIEGCRIPFGDPAWPGSGGNEDTTKVQRQTKQSRVGFGGASPGDAVALYKEGGRWPANIYYCKKANRNERDCGGEVENIHTTVKPVDLMRWLVRLVTPEGGVVLEPYCGSGTTLLAAELEGFDCIAVEREPEYCDIIKARWESYQ